MQKRSTRRLRRGGLSLFTALALLGSSCLLNVSTISAQTNEESTTIRENTDTHAIAEQMAQAVEVSWLAAASADVTTPEDFASAYVNAKIARINVQNEIDLTSVQHHLAYHQLNRGLQIEGNGHTLKTLAGEPNNNQSVFNLSDIGEDERAVLHLKDVNVWTRGTRYVDSGPGEQAATAGWQLILDNVRFDSHEREDGKQGVDQARHAASLPSGRIFLRHHVHMETYAENLIAGQITVEEYASSHGKVTSDASNIWFSHPNKNISTVDNILTVGPRAVVELSADNGRSYPAIASHWQMINVHGGASLTVERPGNAYTFTYTNGMTDKAIHVLEGASFVARDTGSKGTPLINEIAETERYPLTSHFYAAPGSHVELIGRTNKASVPLVNLRNNRSSFTLDGPASYDIRNNLNKRGAKAIAVAKDGHFHINNANIGVWDATRTVADLDGPAHVAWYGASIAADGAGKAIDGTESPNNPTTNLRDTWNTTKYARISNEVPAAPTIEAKRSVVYDKNASITEDRFLRDVITGHSPLAKIESNFDDVVALDTIGVYVVSLQGVDSVGNQGEATAVSVIIKDEHTIIDTYNDTMLRAANVSINMPAVPSANWVELAQAEAWKISTGETVTVDVYGRRPDVTGTHVLAFIAEKTIKSIEVTVTNYETPTLDAQRRIYYPVGTYPSPKDFLQDVRASLDGEGTITSDFATKVDLTKVGAYAVTIRGVSGEGHETNAIQTIVFMMDRDTRIDDNGNFMIRAVDFTIDSSQLENADFTTLAEAKAWDLVTGEELLPQLVTERPTGLGTHRLAFLLRDRIWAVYGTITTDEGLFLNARTRMSYYVGTEADGAEFLEDIEATLTGDGVISSDFEDVVNLEEVGAYVVTVRGVDANGNVSNAIQTIVLVIDDMTTLVDETNNTMLTAQNFGIKLSDVPSDEAGFIELAKAKAWTISTAEPLEVKLLSDIPTRAGMFGLVYGVGISMKLVIAAIVDDVNPIVSARDGVMYEKGMRKTEEDFLADVGASLNTQGVIRSNYNEVVDLDTVGVYIVDLYGEDFVGQTGPITKATVIVADDDTIVDFDNDIMMYGHGFYIPLADVADADFLQRSEAKAWLISTGETVDVKVETEKPESIGTYIVTLSALATTYHEIAVIVTDGEVTEETFIQRKETARDTRTPNGMYTINDKQWTIMSEQGRLLGTRKAE